VAGPGKHPGRVRAREYRAHATLGCAVLTQPERRIARGPKARGVFLAAAKKTADPLQIATPPTWWPCPAARPYTPP
jgi:hypothetical protein